MRGKVIAILFVAACGRDATKSAHDGRFHHEAPRFSIALPKGYAAGPEQTDSIGRQTILLSGADHANDILLAWVKSADPKAQLLVWRQTQQLELRNAKPVDSVQHDGFEMVHYVRDDGSDLVRSAITSGDSVIMCSTTVRSASAEQLGACQGLTP